MLQQTRSPATLCNLSSVEIVTLFCIVSSAVNNVAGTLLCNLNVECLNALTLAMSLAIIAMKNVVRKRDKKKLAIPAGKMHSDIVRFVCKQAN